MPGFKCTEQFQAGNKKSCRWMLIPEVAESYWLCRHAAKLGITLVTITQRAALLKYHSVELRLVDGEGDWQLRAIVPEDS